MVAAMKLYLRNAVSSFPVYCMRVFYGSTYMLNHHVSCPLSLFPCYV